MNTTNLIDQLITTAEQAKIDAQAAEGRQRQEFIERAEQSIAATLGELWNTLQPHVVKAVDGDKRLRVLIGGEGLAAMQLAPFWVHYDTFNEVFLDWSEHPSGRKSYNPQTAGVFFAERRVAFFKQQADALKERIQDATYRARWLSYSPTPERADAALAELLELAPERETEWRRLRAEWQADYDQQQERNAWEARQQELKAEYQATYAVYWEEYQLVLAENRRRIGELRAQLDEPFTFWRLGYGIVASDEDSGERCVDTAYVYVTHATFDAAGFWTVFDGNRIAPRRYTHLVSVEGPLLCRPTDDPYGVHDTYRINAPDGAGVGELRYNPAAVSHADVADMANTVQLAYPDEPEPPAGLETFYAADARRKVVQKDEIPY